MTRKTDQRPSARYLERVREVVKEEEVRQTHKMGLEKEHGVVGNPKAHMLYEKAWDLGHANGYEEVAGHYGDLVELIK